VYCSSACGNGCKRSAYDLAKSRSALLAKRLNKHCPGQAPWKPRVWEDLGWFYEAVSAGGRVTVHPPHFLNDTYWVSVLRPDQFISISKKPEVAVRSALAEARRHVEDLMAQLSLEGH